LLWEGAQMHQQKVHMQHFYSFSWYVRAWTILPVQHCCCRQLPRVVRSHMLAGHERRTRLSRRYPLLLSLSADHDEDDGTCVQPAPEPQAGLARGAVQGAQDQVCMDGRQVRMQGSLMYSSRSCREC
jgi:hypothetical protein